MQPLKLLSVALTAAFLAVALPAESAAQTTDHQYTTADIEAGSRIYVRQCAMCHGATGDQVANVNLRLGRFRAFRSDDDLKEIIRSGVPSAGMPAFPLGETELNGIVAFIRAGFDTSGVAVRIGNVAAGAALFQSAGCMACHRVEGAGPAGPGPDLTDVGAIRQPSALQRKLLDPTGSMLPINRPVRIVTADGETVRGRRLNEDTYTVQVIDNAGHLLSFDKGRLREYELGVNSPMPSYEGRLSADEISHLVGYLLSLTGP